MQLRQWFTVTAFWFLVIKAGVDGCVIVTSLIDKPTTTYESILFVVVAIFFTVTTSVGFYLITKNYFTKRYE